MTTDEDVRRRSVTADDYATQPEGAGPVTVMIGPAGFSWGGLLEGVKGATGLPAYGRWDKARDAILSETPLVEDMWAAAVNIAVTKQTALGFRFEDAEQSDRRIKAAQSLLLQFDGDYSYGLARHLRDYYLTRHAVVEIVRATSARGSRVIGLMHLDSLRCYATGDPEYPMLYYGARGWHRLPAESVLIFTDAPSPRAELPNHGQCAADRSFATLLKRVAIETYVREKVSGTRNLALHFITGVSADKLREALSTSASDQAQRGFVLYRGSTIIPMLGGADNAPQLITIPLAEIPDGFDAAGERTSSNQIYANNLGIPVQDIQPLSGQGLGTGTQSVILDESAQGYGAAQWRRQWQQAMTHRVLPGSTTFFFDTNDVRDRKAAAEVFSTMATAVGGLVAQGVLTGSAALNVLVDADVIDRAYLPADMTPGGALGDLDKAEGDEAAAQSAPAPALAVPVAPPAPTLKAKRRAGPPVDLVVTDEVIAAADALRREVAANE